MAADIVAQIEKEYGEITFRNPSIRFGYNKIELFRKLSITERLLILLIIIFPLTLFMLISFPVEFIFFPLVYILLIFFQYHTIFDAITIDFLQKEIKIENKFHIINSIRNLLRRPLLINFSEVAYFLIDDGGRWFSFTRHLHLHMRTTTLYVRTMHKSEIPLANFNFERDARRLGELLQYYIVGKPGIIE